MNHLKECLYCKKQPKFVDMRTGYYFCDGHRWAVPPDKRREIVNVKKRSTKKIGATA